MITLLYVLTLISTSVGGLILVFGTLQASSAPQEAAVAALAIGLAVIPYVFARCIQLAVDHDSRRAAEKRLIALLEQLNLKPDRIAPLDTPPPAPAPPTPLVVGLGQRRCPKCFQVNNLSALRCGGCGFVFGENPPVA